MSKTDTRAMESASTSEIKVRVREPSTMNSSSDFCQIRTTPYGGRGQFATRNITKGTLVHTCPSPYVFVIYKEFRKEVCANCFAYAFDAGRTTWGVKSDRAWYCSEPCRATESTSEIAKVVHEALDAGVKKMRKRKSIHTPDTSVQTRLITAKSIEYAWKDAQDRIIPPREVVQLDDVQVEIARFAASAVVHAIEAQNVEDLKQLQDNELENLTAKPYMLDVHLRVYTFLRQALPDSLDVHLRSVVRQLLGRDAGNSFGIWQETEMLGYGSYISASFFNHDCSPNLVKRRIGRAMSFYTARDVKADEELCISYVDVEDPREERMEALKLQWFFECTCNRCNTMP